MYNSNPALCFIGQVESPYREQDGTPIQPTSSGAKPMIIRIAPEYREGLEDVRGFSRIWVITWLDRARPYRLRVIPYRDSTERGLFATRAPSRPNPIGISCVKISAVDETTGVIEIESGDILDGTPVLDIKPYVPEFDSFPDSQAGWLSQHTLRDQADNRFADPPPSDND